MDGRGGGRRAVDSSRYINRCPDLWKEARDWEKTYGADRASARARARGARVRECGRRKRRRQRRQRQLRGDLGIRRITSKCLLTHGCVRRGDTASSRVYKRKETGCARGRTAPRGRIYVRRARFSRLRPSRPSVAENVVAATSDRSP